MSKPISMPFNPVVARCEITGDRNVSSHGSLCEHFIPLGGMPKKINKMIKCK